MDKRSQKVANPGQLFSLRQKPEWEKQSERWFFHIPNQNLMLCSWFWAEIRQNFDSKFCLKIAVPSKCVKKVVTWQKHHFRSFLLKKQLSNAPKQANILRDHFVNCIRMFQSIHILLRTHQVHQYFKAVRWLCFTEEIERDFVFLNRCPTCTVLRN